MKKTLLSCAVFCLMSYATGATAKPNINPGEWQTTVKMEMPGMRMDIPPFTASSCVTEKDLVPNTTQPGQDCKVTEQKFDGDNMVWGVACKDKQGNTSTMNGKGTYTKETFVGSMVMKTNREGRNMEMNAKISGKRLGPCKKKK